MQGSHSGRKERLGVEVVVPYKLPHRSMKLLRATFGDDVDQGSRATAKLGAVAGGLDLHFLDRIGVRLHSSIGVAHVVQVVETVNGKHLGTAARRTCRHAIDSLSSSRQIQA